MNGVALRTRPTSTLLGGCFLGIVAVVAATIGAPGVVARDASAAASSSPLEQFTGVTYVAATSNPDLFVAIVVGDPPQARAYLCDNTGTSEWLTGVTDGATLQLSSTADANVEAVVSATGVTGTATLRDGSTVTFDAEPAAGIGGLYTSVISADNRVQGTSSTGAALDGVIAAKSITASGNAVYPLVGLLTPADGEPVVFVVTLTGATAPDEARSIVLNDGQQRGRSRTAARVWVTDPMATSIRDGTSNT